MACNYNTVFTTGHIYVGERRIECNCELTSKTYNICLCVDMPMTHFSFKRYLVLNPVRLIWHCSWRARWLRILWFRNWQEKVAPGKVLCHPHTAKALCLLPATYISKPVPPAILKSSYPQNSESDVNRGHRCLKSYQGHFENIIV